MKHDWERTAEKAVGIIKNLPFTRGVALTGSQAEGRATEQSDIDFFVLVQPGHLWLTRFLVTLALTIAGIRRTDTDIAGKVCLNWFATYNAPEQQKGRVYRWLWQETQPSLPKHLIEWLISSQFLENIARAYQQRRIERDPRTHLPGSQVRYSDTELGFHPPKQK